MKITNVPSLPVAAIESKTQKETPKSKTKTTTKRVPKPKEKKPRFLTLTKLGQEFALTTAKAKLVLAASGLIGVDQNPTPQAIEKEAFKTRKTIDKYNGLGEVAYLVWDLDKVKRYFTKPDEIQALSQASNRRQLGRRLSEIIMIAARELGFPHDKTEDAEEANRWATTMGMSSETLGVIFEAEYGAAAHYFGMDFSETKQEAQRVFDRMEPAISEIETLLRPEKSQSALVLRGVIDNLRAWLLRNSH